MIYYNLIPIKLEDKLQILISEVNTFFYTPLKSLKHTSFLEKQLKRAFKVNFQINRTFYVANNNDDVILYAFVVPEKDFQADKYVWAELDQLDPDNFNSLDSLALRRLNLEFAS